MNKKPVYEEKILVYDIETAGVNALHADLGHVITFGYIWLDDFEVGKKWKTISICDTKTWKSDPHNDKELVKKALEIIGQAGGIIHHYGNRFDAPFLLTRAVYHKLNAFPDIAMLDTCFLAYKKFKLSSNRLKNIAKFFRCKYQKEEKGNGWPLWWNHYLKGSDKYDSKMRHYCGLDVMTLAEISLRMRPYWPQSFVNRIYPKMIETRCTRCGSDNLHKHGIRIYRRELHQRYRCNKCKCETNYKKLEGAK